MNKAKFTKGPWTVERQVKAQYDSESGERLKDRTTLFVNSDEGAVAVVVSYAIPGAEANANLIAAAPELLEALEVISEAIDAYGGDLHNKLEGVQAVRDAIAKVRGGD